MYLSNIEIENFRIFGEGDQKLNLEFKEGLNLIVGENNSGKTAIIDAIRLILRTRDNERIWLDKKDFYYPAIVKGKEDYAESFAIKCTFKGFKDNEAAPFLEWIGFDKKIQEYYLKLMLIARRTEDETTKYGNRITIDTTAGPDDKGTRMDGLAKDLLRATYLKPLRDAEQELKGKRGSRLSQILFSHPDINTKTEKGKQEKERIEKLVKNLNNEILEEGSVYKQKQEHLNSNYFQKFLFENQSLNANISLIAPDLIDILEKLELKIDKNKPQGLGINNLLFMATELLLLKPEKDEHDLPLLLIEEPEAHIHPQYQLNLINYFESEKDVQVLMTTHSPNLSSKVDLENLIIMKDGQAYPLASDYTHLDKSDYAFLRRFLDVTKANMFFAKGIIFVEGPSEELLLPYIAEKIGLPLHKYGVSIVNVGHRGLYRYSNIFTRKDSKKMNIKIACIGDLDIPVKEATYLKKNDKGELTVKTTNGYTDEEIKEKFKKEKAKYENDFVKFYASVPWTLEYSLAESKLAEQIHIAIQLAKSEAKDKLNNIPDQAKTKFKEWENDSKETKASKIFEPLYKKSASKPETIQYFIEQCEQRIYIPFSKKEIQSMFPEYLIEAIEFVTGQTAKEKEEVEVCQVVTTST